MNDDSKTLYSIGGATAILSGLLLVFSFFWFTLKPVENHPAVHGISVVMLILLIPTIIATTTLLNNEQKTGALLGVGFATLWIVIELIAHVSQTAPLKTVNLLIQDATTMDLGAGINKVWQEWITACKLLGAFLFSLSALCYGLALRKWGNSASAFLLIFAGIVFILTFIPYVDFNWHILVRGLAFLFLGGVLLNAPSGIANDVWEA